MYGKRSESRYCPHEDQSPDKEWLKIPNATFVERLTEGLYPASYEIDLLPSYEEMLVLRETLGKSR